MLKLRSRTSRASTDGKAPSAGRFGKRVVLVTGAASGIGRELCLSFARHGAKIGLIDRDESKLQALAASLRQSGVACATAAVDVRARGRLHDAIGQIVHALGPIDTLIASAGICRASTVDDLRISHLEEIVQINFLGTVYAIEAVLPSMLARGRGHIAGISSMAGVRGIPFEPGYSASKAAVAAYLESLRSELRPRGITVTTVFPGYVQTPLLDEINGMMGSDMSGGKAFTSMAAAERIMAGLKQQRSYVSFPTPLWLSVRLSQLMPPRFYDRIMVRMFRRFAIAHREGVDLGQT
jgi:short-subunit dehydrogenase